MGMDTSPELNIQPAELHFTCALFDLFLLLGTNQSGTKHVTDIILLHCSGAAQLDDHTKTRLV